jgi:hypothetical protein
MNLPASAYGYRLHGFPIGAALPDGLIRYRNDATIRSICLRLEVNGPASGPETTASYAVQGPRATAGSPLLENWAQQIARLRFAPPLGLRFDISSGMQYESSRPAVASNTLLPLSLADLTLTSKRLPRNFDVRVGLGNAFNRSSYDPIALTRGVETMPSPESSSKRIPETE